MTLAMVLTVILIGGGAFADHDYFDAMRLLDFEGSGMLSGE